MRRAPLRAAPRWQRPRGARGRPRRASGPWDRRKGGGQARSLRQRARRGVAWEGGCGAPRAGRVRSGTAAASSIQILCIPFVRPRDTLRGGFNLTLMYFTIFASSGFVFIGCASPLSCRNACGARAGGFRRRAFFCARFLFVPRARSSCAQQRGNAECAWRKREFVVPVRKINMVEKRRERNSARAAQVRAAVGWGGGRAARPPPCKRPRGPPGQASAGGGAPSTLASRESSTLGRARPAPRHSPPPLCAPVCPPT